MMLLHPIIEMPTAMTGTWRRFGVHLFEGRVTVEQMDELDARGTAWSQRNPGKRVEMTIIFPSHTNMTSEERARIARIIKRWEHVRTASATVILATGLLASAQRSVLTGLLLVAPPPHPARVFSATREAIEWIAPHVAAICGPEATAAVIEDAVDDLVARFRASRTARAPAP